MAIHRAGIAFRRLLNHPAKVFVFCALFFVGTLLFNGVLWRLWGLHRDFDRLEGDRIALQEQIRGLDRQLKQAQDPTFIEREARERLDLAGENDLVFIFPDQN